MDAETPDGWKANEKLVLHELERLSASTDALTKQVSASEQ
jgi:hypothetical protein